MLISAVRNYSYSTYIQDKILGYTLSDSELQALMEKYGVMPTGDSDLDIQALYNAMYSKAESIANAAQPTPTAPQKNESTQPQNNVPWANLMKQMDIEVTGNLATDNNTFNQKISAMKVSATTPQDKASISMLEAEAKIVFVQQDQSVQANLQTQEAPQKELASGADIKAALNRLFLLG